MHDQADKRATRDVVTFLTDFGWNGGYVAACEAVIASLRPSLRILHISHEIAVGDISAGALVLERVAPLCTPCVHLAVIDPGVGTTRRPLILTTGRGDILIGPDNGLLLPAAQALGGVETAWVLDPVRLREKAGLADIPLSTTFHGRDVFSPAAALISADADLATLAHETEAELLIRPRRPAWTVANEGVLAEVTEIDRFGNVELAIPFVDLPTTSTILSIVVEGEDLPAWKSRVVDTFARLGSGELGTLCDSWGYVALALNGASAAELLSVERGMNLRLTLLQPSPEGSEG